MEGEYKKGLWTAEEDSILMDYIRVHGKGRWNRISKLTGLKRRGKSCRLRWINYLSPSVKRDEFSEQEDDLIIRLHNLLGNRWSLIAGRLPGRTDNQVKNYWNIHLSKKLGIRKRKLRIGSPSESLSVQERDKGGQFSASPPGLRLDYSSPKSGLDGTTIGIEGENAKNIGSEHAAGFDGTDDASIMNGSYGSSSWILNDDLGLCVPTLLEPLDDYSFDFIWNTF